MNGSRALLAICCGAILCASAWSPVAAEEYGSAKRRWVPVPSSANAEPTAKPRPKPAAALKDGLKPGQRPPGFSLTDLSGRLQNPRTQRNRVVVLHFWATWCPVCRGEIPKLQAIQQHWKPSDVAIITVSRDEHVATLSRFVREQRLTYPVIADAASQGALAALYQLDGVPHTFIIGRDGAIVEHIAGAGELLQAVERALSWSVVITLKS